MRLHSRALRVNDSPEKSAKKLLGVGFLDFYRGKYRFPDQNANIFESKAHERASEGQGMKEIVDVLATANGSRAEQLAARSVFVLSRDSGADHTAVV